MDSQHALRQLRAVHPGAATFHCSSVQCACFDYAEILEQCNTLYCQGLELHIKHAGLGRLEL
jgi:hypothetical protein